MIGGVRPAVPPVQAREDPRTHPGHFGLPHDSKDLETPTQPTIFHITHWKSGSQWIHRILQTGVPRDLIVAPEVEAPQILKRPIEAGKVYPTAYLTREEFESVTLPDPWRAFVVIRDLRDVLISLYFSMKFSHPEIDGRLAGPRESLQRLSVEDGLLYLMETWLPMSADIQRSWIGTSLPLLRYEDLLNHDVAMLERVLVDHCRLSIGRQRLREIILNHRFERLTGGRPRGREDVMSHERKGVAGDWIPYFTPRIARAFNARFGDLLIRTGYESRADWAETLQVAV